MSSVTVAIHKIIVYSTKINYRYSYNFFRRTLSKTRKSESKSYITEQKSPEFGRKAIQHKSHKLSQSLTDILTAVFNASEDQLKRFQESLICNDTLTTEITFDGK